MPQCVGGPARVLRALVCQQARSLFEGSGGSDSSAVDTILSLEMCFRCRLQNDQQGAW